LILGTLFSQITIETTSRDPSTAAEFTLWHAARCKLRHNLPNLFPCPSFCRGYVRLMIHSRISARPLRLDYVGCSHAYTQDYTRGWFRFRMEIPHCYNWVQPHGTDYKIDDRRAGRNQLRLRFPLCEMRPQARSFS
jgi:hypothetical protein